MIGFACTGEEPVSCNEPFERGDNVRISLAGGLLQVLLQGQGIWDARIAKVSKICTQSATINYGIF